MTPENLVDDKEALEGLESGFTPDTVTTPPAPPASGAQPEGEKPTDDTPAPAEPPPAAPPAPEYVQITKEQFASFEAAAAKTADVEKQLTKAFGTLGNVQQIIKDLQTATPKGMDVDLPADVLSEMEGEFPEIATLMRPALEKALKGIKGTGGAKAEGLDQDAVNKLVSEASRGHALEALEDAHPDWQGIVAPIKDGKLDPESPFRKWLATQPDEYQEKINSTNNPLLVLRAIDKFQAAPKAEPPKPAPQTQARRDRVAAAVQPKGDGGQPPPAKSDTDEFEAGFNTG